MIEGYKASDAWAVMKLSSGHNMVSFASRQGILLLNAYAALCYVCLVNEIALICFVLIVNY